MNELMERYDIETAAAWILGHARRTGIPSLSEKLQSRNAGECTVEELIQIFTAGQEAELKFYPFKVGTQMLARTKRTLGFLHSISIETMLDVGSGRGVFLIPFMKAFPWVQVTSLDLLDKRVTFLNDLADGGFYQLQAYQKDICEQPFPDNHFDVVSLLEVLEPIPAVEKAATAAVRMAKQYVVVTVPSKPDNNPDARPDLATVTLLCLALKLEPEISDVLLKFSGNLIPYDPDVTFCRELIREKHTYSIDQIDQYLVEQGASPLSKRNTLAQ